MTAPIAASISREAPWSQCVLTRGCHRFGTSRLRPLALTSVDEDVKRAVSTQAGAAQANLQTVRQYYAAMIEGVSPNIAGLTLMMTLMPKGGDIVVDKR